MCDFLVAVFSWWYLQKLKIKDLKGGIEKLDGRVNDTGIYRVSNLVFYA